MRSPLLTFSGILSLAGALVLLVAAGTKHDHWSSYGVALLGISSLATEKKLVSDQRWLWFLRIAGAGVLVAALVSIIS